MPHPKKTNSLLISYKKDAVIAAWAEDLTSWLQDRLPDVKVDNDIIECFKALLNHHGHQYDRSMKLQIPQHDVKLSDCRRIIHQAPFWFYPFQVSAMINYNDYLKLYRDYKDNQRSFLLPIIINNGTIDHVFFLGQSSMITSVNDATVTSHLHNEQTQIHRFDQYQAAQGLRNKYDLNLKQWAKAIASSELCWQRYERLNLRSEWMKTLCNTKILLNETQRTKWHFFSSSPSDTDQLAFIPLANTPHNKHEVMLQAIRINPHGKISHQSYWTFQLEDLIKFESTKITTCDSHYYLTARNSEGKTARFMYYVDGDDWKLHSMTTKAHEIKRQVTEATVTSPMQMRS
ncbi:MAG: hypothetical protein CL816_00225 [Coxiellaceae bacterium]|nr:hypothetical protein [Coxiellaceae bacterium]